MSSMYGQDGRSAPPYGEGGKGYGGGAYGSYGGNNSSGSGGRVGEGQRGRGGGGYGGEDRGGGGYGASSQYRGGGDGGQIVGDSSSGRGGGRGGSGRDGDWVCPNSSCGNVNFARRVECNKCGTRSPAGNNDRSSNSSGGGGGGGYSKGGFDGRGDGDRSGNQSGDRGGDYDGRSGRSKGGNHVLAPPPYGGLLGNHPPAPNSYGGDRGYGMAAVPPPSSYTGRPTLLPPSYGGSFGSNEIGDTRSGNRAGPTGGYSSSGSRDQGGGHGAPADSSVKVKQCDEKCGDTCDNSRIYISNLPPDVKTEELRELFSGIGQIGRIKQKRGFKDQWPWNIKIYTDEKGNNKGDAVLSYEDPSAAHAAGGFYNGYELRGKKISVTMAEKTVLKTTQSHNNGGGGGGRGGYGGGERRNNYRDGMGSGPDRHQYGGNRSRPY